MSQRLIQRSLSLGLSFVLTLAMLGSIDSLSQPDEAKVQMAQKAAQKSSSRV